MPPCARRVKIDMRGDLWPARGIGGVLGDNSAATAKWRWTCSHVADAAPEWPALLAATTTATLILRADPSYPTVALFHVSLTLRKNLKRRAAESPTSRSACLLVSRTVLTHPYTHFGLTEAMPESLTPKRLPKRGARRGDITAA